MKNKIVLLFLITLSAIALRAADRNSMLQQAAKDYQNGNMTGAIAAYDSVLKEDGPSAGILYNLGNAYTNEKNYGLARVSYERALKLSPGDKVISNNLDYLISRIDIQNRNDLKGQPLNIQPEDPWFFRSIYNFITLKVTSNTWAVYGVVAFILFILLTGDYLFTKRVWMRKIGFFGALVMLGLSIIFVIFALTARNESKSHDWAVITATKVQLLTEPSDKGKTKATPLNAGTKLEITETHGGTYEHPEWYNVYLNSDFNGWVKAGEVEVI